MEIKFKKLVEEAKTPLKIHDVDAGFDLYAISIEKNMNYIEYRTGIAFEIPEGYVGLTFSRSSVTNKDLILKNSVGVIDSSYRNDIRFRFYDTNAITYNMNDVKTIINSDNIYTIGERIGQIVFLELPKVELVESDELSETIRGTNGYGSTGTH
jgi:dUTP pyrophosphatase